MNTPTETSRPLCPREIRGMLTIAKAAERELRCQGQSLRDILSSLDMAISYGRPDFFIKDCTREIARNWCRK